jgi:acetolactate synthase-1/2/3 large subunit
LAQIGGLRYVACRTYSELEAAIAELQHDARVLIDVFLDEDSYRGPAITTKFDANGTPYSTDLEDVEWR